MFKLFRNHELVISRRDWRSHVAPFVRGIKMCSTADTSGIDVQGLVTEKLTKQFSPAKLDVINESYMHNVPKGAQSHFKVIVVSDSFKGQSLINRHKAVQETLRDEIANMIHAISIVAKTPEEWEKTNPGSSKSPACLGGMKAEAAQKTTVS